ncbi:condensation domain-containing protein [Cellulosimicrobium funkei]|uniref:condensation domain-containing protein n=1 Tax=Cellulosimicrobium sp. SL-1 TaxID=2699423 RepID=UPI0013D0F42B|nr:condensation domain-containing protein [Cellulosimicrobium sp. SL-1]
MRVVHRVEVRGSAGEGPATWGQTAIRRALVALAPQDHQFNLVWGGPLDRPLPTAAAVEVVRALVERHDSLRTRIHARGDGFAQELCGAGTVEVVEERVDDLAAVAVRGARMRHELWGRAFDYATDLPVRAGLVTVDGAVHHTVLVVAHTALDGWGLPVLDADLTALAAGSAPPERAAWTPLDEAAWQTSHDGRRHDAAARARTLRTMRAAPVVVFPRGSAEGPDGGAAGEAVAAARPRYRQTVLRSLRLGPAAERVAARWRTSTSGVLLAASCRALAAAAGRDDLALQVMVSNRFRPALADAVVTTAMEGLLHVDGLDAPFEEVGPRVWRAAMTAYRSAYYDKDLLRREAAADPTTVHDGTCWYNDRRGTGPDRTLRARPTRSRRLACADASDEQGGVTLTLHLVDAPDGGVDVVLTADAARLDDATAASVVRDVERTVLAASRAPTPSSPRRGPRPTAP